MFLAEETAGEVVRFHGFDIFMLAFTVIIFIGLVRLLTARPRKNLFAIGFASVSFLLFVAIDFIMVTKIWMG